MLKRILTILISFLLLLSFYIGISNYRYFLDFYAKNISSENNTAKLYSTKLLLTDEADLILHGTYPKIEEKNIFNLKCKPADNVIELGCYITGKNNIYVLNINEPNLESIEDVTMAHELLHATYERKSTKQKNNIKDLIDFELTKLSQDKKLQERLISYEKIQPGSKYSEMFSILGTEYDSLSAELENIYKKYFTNREEIVNKYKNSELYITNKEQEINNMKKDIENSQLNLKTLEAKMDKLKNSEKIEEYNSLVPKQNSMVESLNNKINLYNEKINSYNDIINSVNSKSYSSFDNI